MTARVAIALVLLVLLAALYTLAPALNVSRWLIGLCSTYLAATLAVRIFTPPAAARAAPSTRSGSRPIGVDLVAFSTLQFLQAGGINYSPLFALPVLMGSVLGSGAAGPGHRGRRDAAAAHRRLGAVAARARPRRRRASCRPA